MPVSFKSFPLDTFCDSIANNNPPLFAVVFNFNSTFSMLLSLLCSPIFVNIISIILSLFMLLAVNRVSSIPKILSISCAFAVFVFFGFVINSITFAKVFIPSTPILSALSFSILNIS